jgi:hypothetical protein
MLIIEEQLVGRIDRVVWLEAPELAYLFANFAFKLNITADAHATADI